MEPRDEYIHDYPEDLDAPWKENWYYNFIDRKNGVWGINHISLMRHTNKGRFSCVHVVDDQILPYSNRIDIADLKETTDGKLKVEVIEPFKKFKVTFDGPMHRLELDYEGIFPVYLYKRPVQSKDQPLSVDHYRQTCIARGTLTKGDDTRRIECYCDRDHTWGFRDEGKLTGWNWAGAYVPHKNINFHRILMGEAFYGTGHISTADGNTSMVRVTVEDTKFENNAPISSVFTGWDKAGKVIAKVKTEKFAGLALPMADKEGVVVYENFAEFTDLETGEKCNGVDEYLINPNEKYF